VLRFNNLQKRKHKVRAFQAITAIVFFAVLFSSCVTGSSIIIGKTKPAINPSQVKLFIDPPTQYEIIGIVEAIGEVGFSRQETQDKVMKELKLRAAKMGANGVLLTNTGSHTSGTTGFYSNGIFYGGASDKLTAQGRAIYVIQE